MKIESIEAIPLSAELAQPFRFGRITRTRSANVALKLHTSDGITGWGEACPVPQLTGETQSSVVEVVEQRIAPQILGRDPIERERILMQVAQANYGIDFTLSALDAALLDVIGKAASLSVSNLLGGCLIDKVEVHGSVGWEEDPTAVAESASSSAEHFRWLKLYAGRGSVEGDLSRIEAARAAVGSEHPFLVDINGLWSPADVARAAPRLKEVDVRLVEQPVHPADLVGSAEITRLLVHEFGIEVVADESVRTPADAARVCVSRAASIINVGVSKLGGIGPALRAVSVARAHGLGVMVGGVVELGLANAAGLHLAALAGDQAGPAYMMGPLKYRRQITTPLIVPVGSTLEVPTGPGLGVTVDEDVVRELDIRNQG